MCVRFLCGKSTFNSCVPLILILLGIFQFSELEVYILTVLSFEMAFSSLYKHIIIAWGEELAWDVHWWNNKFLQMSFFCLIHKGHLKVWNSSHFCLMGINTYRGESECLLRQSSPTSLDVFQSCDMATRMHCFVSE